MMGFDGYYDAVKSGSLGALAGLDLGPGPVVTVCGVGTTAAKATALLRAEGVEARTLEGGMRAWSLAWNLAEADVSGHQVVQVRRTGKGHALEPIPLDGRLLATTIGEIRDKVALARLPEEEFVKAALARIPPSPPNHSLIVELNERGELPEDPEELEAGANRCAVA